MTAPRVDSAALTGITGSATIAASPVTLRTAARNAWRKGVQVCRLIIGVPDYDTYVEHVRRFHPESTPMTYEEFFIERQNARYKGGGGRCC